MAYFIFLKNQPNVFGTLYKIAANDNDLSNQNIDKNTYNIITDTDTNFISVQLGTQQAILYSDTNVITYQPLSISFQNQISLNNYIKNYSNQIINFINNNPLNPWLPVWNSYNNQLLSTNTKPNTSTYTQGITYPLNMSLEQYYKNNNSTVLNPLQLP